MLDKSIVFFTAILVAEIFLKTLRFKSPASHIGIFSARIIENFLSKLPNKVLIQWAQFRKCSQEPKSNLSISGRRVTESSYETLSAFWVGMATFALFTSSIWTFQMYRAMWNEMWFLFLFFLSLFFLIDRKFWRGLLAISVGSLMSYMQGFILAVFFLTLILLNRTCKKSRYFQRFISEVFSTKQKLLIYGAFCLFPAALNLTLRSLYVSATSYDGVGSSLLFRIGISGDDTHNGGILGALQFLGGIRITNCFAEIVSNGLSGISLESKIFAFNCVLSVTGMLSLSLLSILGTLWLLKNRVQTRIFLFPIGMTLLISAATLQQSFSAHLMGHSYSFSVIFSCGFLGICLELARRVKDEIISTLTFSVLVWAVILMSIRISLLNKI
jgi:hypothetical protein